MKPVITFTNVTKQYALQEHRTIKDLIPGLLFQRSWSRQYKALDDVTFTVNQGETVGIIGKNGAGKSTLLKLIAGVTYPSFGSISCTGKVAPLIELGAGFHHELTGYENIYLNAAILGMHKREIEREINNIISFSELEEFIDTPVKKYSTGMYMRLAFSIAVHTNADILLIDEVLAVGDDEFQKKCLSKLKDVKKDHLKTIIFISHDQESVTGFCDRALLMHKGQLRFDGTPKEAFASYHKLNQADGEHQAD